MKTDLQIILTRTKEATTIFSLLSAEQKKKILFDLADILQKHKETILIENKKDIDQALKNGRSKSFIDRLTLTDKTFSTMLEQVKQIAELPDGLGETIEERTLANGVLLKKIRVPLGVIALIYESRPNITIDAAALCLKSGNAVVLKGGSEALNTNRVLVNCIQQVLKKHNIPEEAITFLDTSDRNVVTELLKQNQFIDVVIPRGGYDLVQKIVSESKIPVLYHASGGARIYVDESANLDIALNVITNAKTNRPATCNSLDTVIVNKNIAKEFLPLLVNKLQEFNVKVLGDGETKKIIKVEKATAQDYATEFLDLVLTIKIVNNIDEALAFIKTNTKNHTEGIIAENKGIINKFISSVDAAGIFVNCSTRLHDGGIFELGAEMGVATGKLHARGPVGLKELTTYKWVALGNGQIRE